MPVKAIPLLILLMVMLGCSAAKSPETPPEGMNVTQRIEWFCENSIRPIRRNTVMLDNVMTSNQPQPTEKVVIISADGTAIGRYSSFMGEMANVSEPDSFDYKSEEAMRVAKRIRESTYQVDAADGNIYTYKITAVSSICNSVVLKPVDDIGPQIYISMSQMAAPQLAQHYLLYEARGNASDADTFEDTHPVSSPSCENITIDGSADWPMSASERLIFRPSDGSFVGFGAANPSHSMVINADVKPLMAFLEAAASVQLVNAREPQAPLSRLYQSMIQSVPPLVVTPSDATTSLRGVVIRSDGLSLCNTSSITNSDKSTGRMVRLNRQAVVMRFMKHVPELDSDIWLPVSAPSGIVPMQQTAASEIKAGDKVFAAEYNYDASPTPYVTPATVSSISPFRLDLVKTTSRCWIFNSKGYLQGLVLGKGNPKHIMFVSYRKLLQAAMSCK